MITDPISDMLTRIRNAVAVSKQTVDMPYSNLKFALAKIMEREGYLRDVTQTKEGNKAILRVGLKYENTQPAIRSLKRVSRPGRRLYAKHDELKRVMSGFGISILSTPNGLMTNKEARARHLGGEVICEIF